MRRLLKSIPFAVLAVGLTLLLSLGWLMISELPVPWLAEHLAAWTQGRLQVTEAQGSLYKGLRLGSVQVNLPGMSLRGQGVQLEWSLRNVVQKELTIGQVHVDDLRLRLTPTDSPNKPQLPASLRLPFAVQLAELAIDRLQIMRFDSVQEWRNLHGRWRTDDDHYAAGLSVESSPIGPVHTDLLIGVDPPFALTGSASLAALPSPHPAHLTVRLQGTLAAPELTLQGGSLGTSLHSEIVLSPFATVPWQKIELALDELVPSDWQPEAPHGTFAMHLQAAANSQGRLSGQASINNADPGAIDVHQIPLHALRTALAGTWPDVELHDLIMDLGPAGPLRGSGHVRLSGVDLALTTEALNLQGVRSSWASTALRGALALHAKPEAQSITLAMGDGDKHIQLEARHDATDITVEKLHIAAGGGHAMLSGRMGLTELQRFDFSGTLHRLNPAAFGDYPDARVSAEVSARGQLMPVLLGKAHWTLRDSQLKGKPISGHGSIERLVEDRLAIDGRLDLLGNILTAQGAWGGPKTDLSWRLDAPRLELLQVGVQGTVSGHGRLKGDPARPAGEFEIETRDLRLTANRRLARGHATANLEPGGDGKLTMHMDLQGLQVGSVPVDSAQARVQGRIAAHEVTLSVLGPRLQADAMLRGGWYDAHWQGHILQLCNKGDYPIELLRPAGLSWSLQKLALAQADLRVMDEGEVKLRHVQRSARGWSTEGQIVRLPLRPVFASVPVPGMAKSDLVLGGRWNFNSGPDVRGEAQLERLSGDLVVAGDEPLPLLLQQLKVILKLEPHTAALSAVVRGDRIGRVDLDSSAKVRANDLRNSPIALHAQASIPSLAWLKLLHPKFEPDGQLQVALDASGTLAHPSARGTLQGQALSLAVPEEGVALTNGTLQAVMDGPQVQVHKLSVTSGEGSLSAQGALSLDKQQSTLQYAMKNFTLMARPDREAVLSGNGTLQTRGDAVILHGDWQFDKGRFELQDSSRPVLGKDVVVMGSEGEEESKPLQQPLPLRVRLSLDMGQHFDIEGRGVQANLVGRLRVNAAPGRSPRAFGTINVEKGVVRQYGQELTVESGAVNFNGPPDNPGLNIMARRKRSESNWTASDDVDVRLIINGTAGKPKVSLVSTPVVPDSEKLAWLVLGHGLQGAERAELDALGAAAAALLSSDDSSSLQARIANAIGVEEIGLRRDATQQQTFATLGKRISSRAYLTLEQALGGASSLAKLRYQLTKRWSLQATTGTESALDMFYSWRFD